MNSYTPAMSSPIPGLLPGCLITTTSAATNMFSIVGIIASIVYETSELFVLLKVVLTQKPGISTSPFWKCLLGEGEKVQRRSKPITEENIWWCNHILLDLSSWVWWTVRPYIRLSHIFDSHFNIGGYLMVCFEWSNPGTICHVGPLPT